MSKNATGARPTCAATSQDAAARRGIRRIPEATRVASAQDLDTARSASHRPTRNRGKTMDGTNAIAADASRGTTVMQGIIEVRSNRKERPEDDLEGEQGPGRVGQRDTGNGTRWYGPASGAKPRGTRSLRYDKNGESLNGFIGRVADRRRQKVRGGKDHGDVERLQAGGILRGVRKSMRGTANPSDQQETVSAMAALSGQAPPDQAEETHRTLRLAAERNKSASPSSP